MQNVDKKHKGEPTEIKITEYIWRYSLMDQKEGDREFKNGCKTVSHELRDQHNICVQPNGV